MNILIFIITKIIRKRYNLDVGAIHELPLQICRDAKFCVFTSL